MYLHASELGEWIAATVQVLHFNFELELVALTKARLPPSFPALLALRVRYEKKY